MYSPTHPTRQTANSIYHRTQNTQPMYPRCRPSSRRWKQHISPKNPHSLARSAMLFAARPTRVVRPDWITRMPQEIASLCRNAADDLILPNGQRYARGPAPTTDEESRHRPRPGSPRPRLSKWVAGRQRPPMSPMRGEKGGFHALSLIGAAAMSRILVDS